MIILSAPSGAGKTTLCRALVGDDKIIRYSVSASTRPQYRQEVDGEDYFFVSEAEFDKMIKQGDLLEWEEVYGYRYGTPRSNVEALFGQGLDVVLDLDIKGALHLKELYPESVTVFLLPPSMEELERRLSSRARDDDETIQARLARARAEIDRAGQFDYVLLNDALAETIRHLHGIIQAERSRAARIEEIELPEDQ